MSSNPFIGQMDRRITVKSVTKSQNSTGEEVSTLATVAQPWAYMEEKNGNEDIEGKVIHIVDRSYIIRYNDTIKTSGFEMKVIDGSDEFDIYHVKELGRRQHLQLLVTRNE